MTSIDRIQVARSALHRAASSRGGNPEFTDSSIVQLLIDLRHFCKASGIDFETCSFLAAKYARMAPGPDFS